MNEDLKTGDSIPSMRVLARNLKVAVITVQKAYENLQKDGFIETIQYQISLLFPHLFETFQVYKK